MDFGLRIFDFSPQLRPRQEYGGETRYAWIFAIDPAFAGHAYAWIAHAKPRQEPRPGRGRYGVKPLTLLRSVSVNLAELRRAPGAGGGGGFLAGGWAGRA